MASGLKYIRREDYNDAVTWFNDSVSTTAGGWCDVPYLALGLTGEAGEYAEKVKKRLRGDTASNEPGYNLAMAQELGDVLWYLVASAYELGFSLEDIMILNHNKRVDRDERGVQKGSGDNR